MDYEQKYKEALERAKKWYNAPNVDKIPTFGNRVIEDIFPELKESEDEKIRKALVQFIKNWKDPNNIGRPHDFPTLTRNVEQCDRYIAWLEKQGEPKSADEVGPKFKADDWIIQENIGVYKVIEICESWYEVVDNKDKHYSIGFDKEYMCRLWTIQDAKDGDILQLGLVTAIFQEYIGNGKCKCYCSICGEFDIPSQDGDDNSYGCYDATPATKEQRDILMKAMEDKGYTFDFEKKEFKNIEKTPAWGEDDKDFMYDTLSNLTELKDRYGDGYGNVGKCIDWLKSLKERVQPQNRWKPSDEQMEALDWALSLAKNCGEECAFYLRTLQDQLKKLKE